MSLSVLEAHCMSLVGIYLSNKARFIYADDLGSRTRPPELVLDAVWANCADCASTSVARRLFQSSLRERHRCLSIPIVDVIAF